MFPTKPTIKQLVQMKQLLLRQSFHWKNRNNLSSQPFIKCGSLLLLKTSRSCSILTLVFYVYLCVCYGPVFPQLPPRWGVTTPHVTLHPSGIHPHNTTGHNKCSLKTQHVGYSWFGPCFSSEGIIYSTTGKNFASPVKKMT